MRQSKHERIHDCFSVADVMIDKMAELGREIEPGTKAAPLFIDIYGDLKWIHDQLKTLDVETRRK